MKRIISVLSLFTVIIASAQTEGYEIKVSFKPFKQQYVYLGHYFGAKQYPIIDSVLLDDKSEGVFKGNKKLGRGIYLLGYPNKSGFYELLMDFDQKFTIRIDTTSSITGIYYENSEYNNEFTAYQKFMGEKGLMISNLKGRLASALYKNDSVLLQNEIIKTDSEITKYRDSLIKKNPKGILSRLLKGMEEPVLQPPYSNPKNKADSLAAYYYYKNHFWDGVDFWDDLFARTTFFEGKLDKYFEQIVAPSADSVIKEMDYMLSFASISPDMTRFLLAKFINRYYNQKYMWEDAVFVHLYEKYLANADYPWMNANGKKMVTDRAYSLMANILGTPAADIELPDSTGKKISLYGVNAPFTIVCFWDATCGHCKETLPKIDSMYKAKWKAAGIKIFSVSKETSGNIKDWKSYIREEKLNWINVFYSRVEEHTRITAKIPGYSQLYDVQTFPTLYLLDKDKRIIAKKLGYEQMDDIINLKLKKTN
jgi:thiol-disulfide isomerase/thioredoxin